MIAVPAIAFVETSIFWRNLVTHFIPFLSKTTSKPFCGYVSYMDLKEHTVEENPLKLGSLQQTRKLFIFFSSKMEKRKGKSPTLHRHLRLGLELPGSGQREKTLGMLASTLRECLFEESLVLSLSLSLPGLPSLLRVQKQFRKTSSQVNDHLASYTFFSSNFSDSKYGLCLCWKVWITEIGDDVSAWGLARCIMWGRMLRHDIALIPALELSRHC